VFHREVRRLGDSERRDPLLDAVAGRYPSRRSRCCIFLCIVVVVVFGIIVVVVVVIDIVVCVVVGVVGVVVGVVVGIVVVFGVVVGVVAVSIKVLLVRFMLRFFNLHILPIVTLLKPLQFAGYGLCVILVLNCHVDAGRLCFRGAS